MKLSRLFQSKASAFRETVAADDLPRMEKLMEKKGFDFFTEILSGTYVTDLTPRMTALLADKLDDKVLARWQFKRGSRDTVLNSMFGYAVHYNKQDVVETLLGKAGSDFNRKGGAYYLNAVIESKFAAEAKLGYLRKILSGGNDLMTEKEETIKAAVEKNDLPALDLLAAAGFRVREQANALLPVAVRNKSAETAAHLVTKFGADIDAAIASGKAVGNETEAAFLESVRAQLPQSEKPRTVESLTAEVASLNETVRRLSERLGEQPLNKPVLKSPQP